LAAEKLDIALKKDYIKTSIKRGRSQMKNKKTETLGLFAGLLTTSSFVPQVYTLWHMSPRPAPAVSLWMYIVIVVGVIFWIIYGFKIRSSAVMIWNTITFGLALSVLVYKLMYG
jgi:MtN3 and saliva related transmembrane protein